MAIDLKLHKQIQLKASKEDVWDALTNPDIIKQYMFGANAISDWKLGSELIFEGEYQGQHYRDKGHIMKISPEKILQYNYWSGFSGLPDKPENYMIITFEIEDAEGDTLLKLTQSQFNNKTQYEHSDKGWDSCFAIIKDILEK